MSQSTHLPLRSKEPRVPKKNFIVACSTEADGKKLAWQTRITNVNVFPLKMKEIPTMAERTEFAVGIIFSAWQCDKEKQSGGYVFQAEFIGYKETEREADELASLINREMDEESMRDIQEEGEMQENKNDPNYIPNDSEASDDGNDKQKVPDKDSDDDKRLKGFQHGKRATPVPSPIASGEDDAVSVDIDEESDVELKLAGTSKKKRTLNVKQKIDTSTPKNAKEAKLNKAKKDKRRLQDGIIEFSKSGKGAPATVAPVDDTPIVITTTEWNTMITLLKGVAKDAKETASAVRKIKSVVSNIQLNVTNGTDGAQSMRQLLSMPSSIENEPPLFNVDEAMWMDVDVKDRFNDYYRKEGHKPNFPRLLGQQMWGNRKLAFWLLEKRPGKTVTKMHLATIDKSGVALFFETCKRWFMRRYEKAATTAGQLPQTADPQYENKKQQHRTSRDIDYKKMLNINVWRVNQVGNDYYKTYYRTLSAWYYDIIVKCDTKPHELWEESWELVPWEQLTTSRTKVKKIKRREGSALLARVVAESKKLFVENLEPILGKPGTVKRYIRKWVEKSESLALLESVDNDGVDESVGGGSDMESEAEKD